jgi:hypothetical protein
MKDPGPELRIDKKAMATVALWAENHNKPVLLGELPRSHFMFNTVQDNHLLDLYDALNRTFYMAFKEEVSHYAACLFEFPDIALHLHDQYMASLINEVCEMPQVQTLFVVCGQGQSRSIPHYMAHSEKDLNALTSLMPIRESLLQKDSVEQQIDKLCVLDLMMGPKFE